MYVRITITRRVQGLYSRVVTITKSSNTIVLTADSRVSIWEKTIIKKGVEFLEIVDRIPRPWLPALSLDRKKKLEKKLLYVIKGEKNLKFPKQSAQGRWKKGKQREKSCIWNKGTPPRESSKFSVKSFKFVKVVSIYFGN